MAGLATDAEQKLQTSHCDGDKRGSLGIFKLPATKSNKQLWKVLKLMCFVVSMIALKSATFSKEVTPGVIKVRHPH